MGLLLTGILHSQLKRSLSIVDCSSQAFKRGGRPDAKKVMIVITDGESHDSPDLKKAVEESEKDNITLYGIAVSLLYLFHPFAMQFRIISYQMHQQSYFICYLYVFFTNK